MKPKVATKPRYARAARPQVDAAEKERGYLETLRRIHETGVYLDTEATGLQHPHDLIEADEFMQGLYGKKTRYWALRAKALKEGDVVKPMGDCIVEIAAIRAFDGKELFHSYVRPVEKFNPVAKSLLSNAGFDFNASIRAPEWPEVWEGLVKSVPDGAKLWSGWNADFDNRMISAMSYRYQLSLEAISHPLIQSSYAMRDGSSLEFLSLFPCVDALTPYCEFTKTPRGSRSLVKCMQHAGLQYRGARGLHGEQGERENRESEVGPSIGPMRGAHGALSDCHAVRDLIQTVLLRYPGGKNA